MYSVLAGQMLGAVGHGSQGPSIHQGSSNFLPRLKRVYRPVVKRVCVHCMWTAPAAERPQTDLHLMHKRVKPVLSPGCALP